jgi:hypothetical protein
LGLALATLVLPMAVQALDLTPRRGFRNLEGFKIPVLYFTDKTRSIKYQPPAHWQVSGGGAQLVLTPPDAEDAEMKWRLLARPPTEQAAPTPEQLAKLAQTFLPTQVDELKLLEKHQNPFTLGDSGSLEFVFTYLIGGRRFDESISICDLSQTERLIVQISARHDDFSNVRTAAIGSLFSWQ